METQKETIVVKEGLKYSTAGLIGLFIFVIAFACGFAVSRKYSPCVELPVVNVSRDTVTVRDTVAGKVLPPRTQTIIRVDTVRLQINPVDGGKFETDTNTRQSIPDTTTTPRKGPNGEILVPISRKVFQTDDYKAVVSGWRPSLDTIEIYRDTRTITETVTKLQPAKRKWLALTVGPSVGYGLDKQIRPAISATLGIILISK